MGGGLDQAELRRRAVDGVAEEIAVFGAGAPDSRLIRRDGLIASVVPATPQRSIFNSVFHTDTGGRWRPRSTDLAAAYDDAGVRAWTVWVTDADRAGAELLAGRGHALDTAPRAMALELADLGARAAAAGGNRAAGRRRRGRRRAQRPRLRLRAGRVSRRARGRHRDRLALRRRGRGAGRLRRLDRRRRRLPDHGGGDPTRAPPAGDRRLAPLEGARSSPCRGAR